MTKYIFVTGGVVSSLGKGLTAGAVGLLLESHGLKIALQKLDPYINVDPGTMHIEKQEADTGVLDRGIGAYQAKNPVGVMRV